MRNHLLSIFAQKYICKCKDTYYILQNKYLSIYEDSFGTKIFRYDCALKYILIRFTQQITPHFEFLLPIQELGVIQNSSTHTSTWYSIFYSYHHVIIKKKVFLSFREFINYRVSVLSSLGHPTAPTNYELL